MKIELIINQQIYEAEIKPGDFLAETLRENGFLSVKRGCDTGSCGLCTVWVNGKPVLSCSYLTVRALGKKITTIEGVQDEAKVFAEYLIAEGAEQCGFCSPGFIMTVLALEKELKEPSEKEIIHYLNGNLCRCTGYQGQMRAVKAYLRRHQQ